MPVELGPGCAVLYLGMIVENMCVVLLLRGGAHVPYFCGGCGGCGGAAWGGTYVHVREGRISLQSGRLREKPLDAWMNRCTERVIDRYVSMYRML